MYIYLYQLLSKESNKLVNLRNAGCSIPNNSLFESNVTN